MTINELRKKQKRRSDGRFKRSAVASLHFGELDARTLCRELKISRALLRSWIRWDYRTRVKKYTDMPRTKQTETAAELKKRIAELETALEKTAIRAEANEILVAIALEKYGIDLRKKTGPKR